MSGAEAATISNAELILKERRTLAVEHRAGPTLMPQVKTRPRLKVFARYSGRRNALRSKDGHLTVTDTPETKCCQVSGGYDALGPCHHFLPSRFRHQGPW